jgi:tellurite resistance protein TerC
MHHPLLWTIFAVIMLGFLVVDLGWLNRRPHAVSTRSAALQSLFWVSISLFYAGLVWALDGHAHAAEFLSAYLTEKMLSVDNLFVIMLIFGYFKVAEDKRHRMLYWGIIGALVFRGLFIGLGSVVISHFHWILYLFGAFLVWTGAKLMFKGDDDEEFDGANNKVLAWARRRGLSDFMTVLLVIETTDIMFAFDSIPAVFSISQDPFIVFTSNIFAVMGLRALFFLVDSLMKKLPYLQQGVSAVLVFIGAKMLADIWHWHISSTVSLLVICGILGLSAAASLLKKS